MARKAVVTRTIKSNHIEALCFDVNSHETFTTNVVIGHCPKEEDKLIVILRRMIDTKFVKFISIVENKVFADSYKMDEEKYIENAELVSSAEINEDDEIDEDTEIVE